MAVSTERLMPELARFRAATIAVVNSTRAFMCAWEATDLVMCQAGVESVGRALREMRAAAAKIEGEVRGGGETKRLGVRGGGAGAQQRHGRCDVGQELRGGGGSGGGGGDGALGAKAPGGGGESAG